jgi:hypothetical protein
MIKTENDLQAFEVQDMNNMAKFVYLYDPNNEAVVMYCTTDRKSPYFIEMVNKKPFPLNCINAFEYFKQLWQKALLFNAMNIKFLHWVEPKTFEPLND